MIIHQYGRKAFVGVHTSIDEDLLRLIRLLNPHQI